MHLNPTLRRLADEVALRMTGGSMGTEYSNLVQRAKYVIVDQINYMFRMDNFQMKNLGEDMASIDAALYHYETANIEVSGQRATLNLPVRPIALPHGVGVYEVVLVNDSTGKELPLMPLPPGAKRNFLVSYPIFDTDKKFSSRISKTWGGWYSHKSGMVLELSSSDFATGYTAQLKLVCISVNPLDEDELIPVPADQVNQLIDYAYETMSGQKPVEDNTVNQSKNN